MSSPYSIAVLPFANMSSDPENEYFSDGITEEIINALSHIEGLHVTARTSSFAFKRQNMDVREIAKKLNVSLVLEGSIRKAGNRVKITAQLIRASKGFHIWSDAWEKELRDIFILQEEIARLIAEKVNKDMEPLRPGHAAVIENLDALDYYLRGNYLQHTWDFSKAEQMISAYEKAIEMDPLLTRAYVGLAETLTWLGSTGVVQAQEAQIKIGECIQKVLELDPEMPEIHTMLSLKLFWMDWDLAGALEEADRALKKKPSYPDAMISRGLIQLAAGYIEEALDSFFQAERLNPMSNQVNYTIGLVYLYTREHEKALEYIERNIRIFPGWYAQYLGKLEALCMLNRYEEALDVITQLEKDPGNPMDLDELRAYYYASRGMKKEALELAEIMQENLRMDPHKEPTIYFFLGSTYMLIEEYEKALKYVELGMEQGATPLLFVKVDTIWDEVREHDRFKKAIRRIRYPEDRSRGKAHSKYRKTALEPERAKQLTGELQKVMEDQKPWLDPGMNLNDLAELLNLRPHLLSQILNEYLGMNFYDYINTYRLEHFMRLADKTGSERFTLLSLAYESGFNSKTTFNSFFKRTKGRTPSEYFRSSSDRP